MCNMYIVHFIVTLVCMVTWNHVVVIVHPIIMIHDAADEDEHMIMVVISDRIHASFFCHLLLTCKKMVFYMFYMYLCRLCILDCGFWMCTTDHCTYYLFMCHADSLVKVGKLLAQQLKPNLQYCSSQSTVAPHLACLSGVRFFSYIPDIAGPASPNVSQSPGKK